MGEWRMNIHFSERAAEVTARIPGAIGKGLEFLRAEVTPKVPKETGDLAGSGDVTVQGHSGQLLYPGPYARNQHYSLDFHHNTGQALYIEQPLVQNAHQVFQIVADDLGGALG